MTTTVNNFSINSFCSHSHERILSIPAFLAVTVCFISANKTIFHFCVIDKGLSSGATLKGNRRWLVIKNGSDQPIFMKRERSAKKD